MSGFKGYKDKTSSSFSDKRPPSEKVNSLTKPTTEGNPYWRDLSLGDSTEQRINFPHCAVISAATGQTIPGQAIYNPQECRRRQVPAYTEGLVTHFDSINPSVHVAAHEATHLIQHAGSSNDAGLGAEKHADAVANHVVSGRSARSLLGSRGSRVPSAYRPYTKFSAAEQTALSQWDVGQEAKVGDAGRTLTAGMRTCYAEPSLIDSANKILKGRDSGIVLEKDSDTISGMAPDGSGLKTLTKLKEPKNKYWTDCGRASREIQGPTGQDSETRGVYTDPNTKKRRVTDSTSQYDPEVFRNEIYHKGGLGHDPASARTAYLNLTDAEKDAFDKKMGINRYAAPGVGESYTTRRDDDLVAARDPATVPRGYGFNYHWGAVIMVAEPDRVTFENFAKQGTNYNSQDTKWYFETFGPPSKPGQTFHDKNAGSGNPGDPHFNDYQVGVQGSNNTTMVTRTSAPLSEVEKFSTKELIKQYASAKTEGEKNVINKALGNRYLKVRVDVAKAQEGPDDVYATVEHGGKSKSSGDIELDTGDRNTFWFKLSHLVPITGKITVKVFEWDVFSDDMISIIGFDSPYSKQTDNRPWDGAEYHTSVEFDS